MRREQDSGNEGQKKHNKFREQTPLLLHPPLSSNKPKTTAAEPRSGEIKMRRELVEKSWIKGTESLQDEELHKKVTDQEVWGHNCSLCVRTAM